MPAFTPNPTSLIPSVVTAVGARPGGGTVAARTAVPGRAGLFDALAPLMTDAYGEGLRRSKVEAAVEEFPPEDGRRALLQAVAELAETHGLAADLAASQAEIDLALDLPDPVAPKPVRQAKNKNARRAKGSPLIVPDVIRSCRDRVASLASATDLTRIDAVATLFDQLLTDEKLSTSIRNTLARLQLPVLRMALADDSFFESRTHPTRRLLDRLAATAAEWSPREDREDVGGHAYRAEFERVVYAMIRGSTEDAGEHARLLEGFEQRIIEIALEATRVVDAQADDPDRDVLVIKATIQISQLLADVDADRAIRFFLLDVWSRVLATIVWGRKDGGDAAADALLARAKRLCVDLAWSTLPKSTSGDRARLAGLLPTMVAVLRDGLRMIDYPADDEARFFADWTRGLHVAVRAQGPAPDRRSVHRIGDTGAGERADIDEFVRRLREGSFGHEPERAEPTPAPDGLGATALAASAMRSDAEDTVAPSSRFDTGAFLPTLSELEKGEWFDLREPTGFARVRLSWISPLKTFYLFIGANSALTRSFDPQTLEGLFVRGDMRRLG